MIIEINKAFNHIHYYDDGHYYVNTETGEQLTSVTTYKKKFQNPFEGKTHEYWLNRKALEAGITANEMQDQWDEARIVGVTRGSRIHDYAEQLTLRKHMHLELNIDHMAKLKRQVHQYFSDYPHLINIATELVIGNDLLGGQIDRLVWDTEKEGVYIIDYKGLALDTPIATPKGYTNISDLKVGDIVYDGDGKKTKITHVSDIHYNPCYRITFDTNDVLIADHEHRWIIDKTYDVSSKSFKEEILTTNDLYSHFSNNGTKNKLRIKMHSDIETDNIDLPIDPYILGLWLADGNSHSSAITCVKQDIWNEIEKRGYVISKNLEKRQGFAETKTIYNIRTYLKELNLIDNKHIPDLYLRSSRQQRLNLLRGFMDGDGHYNKKRKRCVMVTTKEWQANDLAKLTNSLGFKTTILKAKAKGFDKIVDCYHVCFTPNVNPFLCRNEDLFFDIKHKRNKHHYIKKIEKIPIVPTKCIAVDSPSKTYLAGYNLIKTHNTDNKNEAGLVKSYKKMKKPLNKMEDSILNGYYIQVNLYREIMEEAGFPIAGMKIVHFRSCCDDYKVYDVPNIDILNK